MVFETAPAPFYAIFPGYSFENAIWSGFFA
jgi:hypothetical protein